MQTERTYVSAGHRDLEEWKEQFLADSENRRLYEEEAAKKELWLQLVEARQTAGLSQRELAKRLGVSQAQVARIEKRGYDAYTLNTLRRYVQALGDGFRLDVSIRTPRTQEQPAHAAVSP
jgi:ribosome-binding protein aMBF1 (putative translation factor)